MTFSKIDGNALVSCLSKAHDMAMLLYDHQGNIIEWNKCLQDKTGLSRKQCIGKKLSEIFFSTKRPSLNEAKHEALTGEAIRHIAVAKIEETNYGQPGFVLHHLPLPDDAKNIDWVAVLVEEQQNKPPSNSKMKSALRVVSDFMHYAPVPLFIVDKNLNIELANTAFSEFINPEDKPIDNLVQVVSASVAKRIKAHVHQVIKEDQVLMFTEDYQPNGETLHLYNILFPVKNKKGEVDSVGGYFIDITERVNHARENKKLLDETLRLNNQLETNNKELEDKRQELAKANRRLKVQKRKLEKVVSELSDRNYELDQIMYKTSHDLRAPLTSVLGLLQLSKQETEQSKLLEYNNYIENRINKLDNFVKAMLNFAKSSRTEIDPKPINWEKMIEESKEQVKYLSNFPQINFDFKCRCQEHEFVSDPIRINIILNNLLGNAVKYANVNQVNPYVRVEVENGPDNSELIISDNGIGIRQEHLSKICDMFYRATDKSEGSGLGMYIVKQTVDRLQGKLTIQSTVNKGTVVRVVFPQLKKNNNSLLVNRKPVSRGKEEAKKVEMTS